MQRDNGFVLQILVDDDGEELSGEKSGFNESRGDCK